MKHFVNKLKILRILDDFNVVDNLYYICKYRLKFGVFGGVSLQTYRIL